MHDRPHTCSTEFPAIPLGWPAVPQAFPRLGRKPALFCDLFALCKALGRFPVEGLGDARWSPHLCQFEHLYRSRYRALSEGQDVARLQIATGLCGALIDLYPAAVDFIHSESSRLEEAGAPEPLVEPGSFGSLLHNFLHCALGFGLSERHAPLLPAVKCLACLKRKDQGVRGKRASSCRFIVRYSSRSISCSCG